jgi:hypothetical protein
MFVVECKLFRCNWVTACEIAITGDIGKRLWANSSPRDYIQLDFDCDNRSARSSRIASVGVPAGVDKFECDINDGLIVEKTPP